MIRDGFFLVLMMEKKVSALFFENILQYYSFVDNFARCVSINKCHRMVDLWIDCTFALF